MGRQGHLQCTEPGRLRKDRASSSEGKRTKKGIADSEACREVMQFSRQVIERGEEVPEGRRGAMWELRGKNHSKNNFTPMCPQAD